MDAMTEARETIGKRDRSPSFPFIPLRNAIERLTAFEEHHKRAGVPPDRVGPSWGMKTNTSQAQQTLAALRAYGLLEIQLTSEGRRVVISEDGRVYLRAQQDSVKQEVLRRAALRPKQIQKYWHDWGTGRPKDAACLDALVVQGGGFSEDGAEKFLKVYDETIAFAELAKSDKMPPADEIRSGDEDEGNLVNGTVDKPNRPPATASIAGELPEGSYVTVSGTMPHLPESKSLAQPGRRQEIIALDEGDVVLSYPDNMSPASFHDLEGYLTLFLRKAQRRAGAGDFFAEVYAPDGLKAKEIRYFDDFPSLMQFIETFRGKASSEILRVHLPRRATDEQRRAVLTTGAQFA